MIGYYIQNKDAFADKAHYVFQQLAQMTGLKMVQVSDISGSSFSTDVLWIYAPAMPSIKIDLPVLFCAQADYTHVASLSQHDVRLVDSVRPDLDDNNLYFFFRDIPHSPTPLYIDKQTSEVLISRDKKTVRCAIDIISTCFYFLSLENERRATDRDKFHRYQRDFSPMGEKIYEFAVVDRYAKMVKRLLLELVPWMTQAPVWPQNKSFAVALSHDVDRIPTWTITKTKRAMRAAHSPIKNPIVRSFRLTQSLAFPENWLGNFNFISRLEERYEAASTFFFVSQHRHELDPTYKMDSQIVRRGMETLLNRGCDIGVHGTIPSATTNGFLELEKEDLEFLIDKDVLGGRQHYLCYTDETPQFWQNAKLQYDSTLGFSYHTGYRCGTSFPFQLHDGQKEMPFLEIPLVLMDTVLFLESKQFLSSAEAWHVIQEHLEETRRNNSLLTINWHNSDLHPYDVYGYSQLYINILKWAQ